MTFSRKLDPGPKVAKLFGQWFGDDRPAFGHDLAIPGAFSADG